MLKLSASYSKKVPAEQSYSSQSYHVSLELELPTGLSADQLQNKIHETFALARDSVEGEIHGTSNALIETPTGSAAPNGRPLPAHNGNQHSPRNNQQRGNANTNERASEKQVKFLNDLLTQHNYNMGEVLEHYRVRSLNEMSRLQCSTLIDQIQSYAKQTNRAA